MMLVCKFEINWSTNKNLKECLQHISDGRTPGISISTAMRGGGGGQKNTSINISHHNEYFVSHSTLINYWKLYYYKFCNKFHTYVKSGSAVSEQMIKM
jgi:hypothetical protein